MLALVVTDAVIHPLLLSSGDRAWLLPVPGLVRVAHLLRPRLSCRRRVPPQLDDDAKRIPHREVDRWMDLPVVLGRLLISYEPGPDAMRPVTRVIAAYGAAIERVLRAPSGAVLLVDAETLETWFASAESAGEAS